MIINPYRYVTGAGATGLLADYPNASAAFSLRQLISTWTGAVVEVRRTAGSPATADFTAAEVGDGTLTTWVGANNGYVKTWYDQSGNGFNVTQATDSRQPTIVSSGTLVTSNGEPAIDFDGSDDSLINLGNLDYTGGLSWYAVADFDTVGTAKRLWCDDITGVQGNVVFYNDNAGIDYQLNDNSTGYKNLDLVAHATVQELSSFHFDNSTGDYEYARDGSNTTGTIGGWGGPIDTGGASNVGVMSTGNEAHNADGKIQELIVYAGDKSTDRVGIESNINTHYTIF